MNAVFHVCAELRLCPHLETKAERQLSVARCVRTQPGKSMATKRAGWEKGSIPHI
ncbi:hypothetical protein DV515_00013439 [Chloebia gouldiae]|uniref:Uncharacterized protein n=1 Tax=Chloebia gouldiae TaxID=44316 RepID=A0A3L8S2C9_CHLGU|nr:hypothetical protein DV515_00013439 [Chloebia gouldiae]